jgi:hypothetical protein
MKAKPIADILSKDWPMIFFFIKNASFPYPP